MQPTMPQPGPYAQGQPPVGTPYAPYGQLPPPMLGAAPLGPARKRTPWGLIIALVLVTLLLCGAAGFGYWAFSERQDYKNNSDKKAAVAAAAAKQAEATTKDKEFAEKEKSPYRTYTGPATYGSLSLVYPKTWSVYMSEQKSGNTVLEGYMHPAVVPGLQSGTAFALRVQIVETSYATELKKFESKVKAGTATVSPFRLEKLPDILGSRIDGEIETDKTGSLILLPLRDKTIEVSTLSTDFKGDFDTIILPNLKFVP